MTIKTSTQVLTAIAGISLSFLPVGLESTQAAIVRYNFTVNLESSFFLTGFPALNIPPNPDYYNGQFSVDDANLTGVGLESLGVDEGLSITLFDDPRIDEEDDERYPASPTVSFQDGKLLGLDYFVIYHPFSAFDNYPGDFFRFANNDFTDGFDPTFYTPENEPRNPILGNGFVTYQVAPEPSLTIGLLAALGLAALSRKAQP
jgi:hypothetical protein